ncbi:MAG: hypothetical protein RSE93_00545 [Oscillospiraceae bacterium]
MIYLKLAIVGSRNSKDLSVDEICECIPKDCVLIISGGASGVDSLAKEASLLKEIPIKEFFPNYTTYGRKAPLIRNQKIVDEADEVLAFWDYKSRGTKSVILYCLKHQKPVHVKIIK